MAGLIPLAIGVGIEESRTWSMTPAEIVEAIKARTRAAQDNLRFFDLQFGRALAYYASAHGVRNAKPADYLIIPQEKSDDERESKYPRKGDSPEMIMKKLKIFTASLGGKVTW